MSRLSFRLSAVSAALLGITTPTPLLAQPAGPYYGHMWEGGWHTWFFGPMMMFIFVAVAVVVIVLIVRWLGLSGHGAPPHHAPFRTPLDILKERFARGEIDKEEFEERRRVLGE